MYNGTKGLVERSRQREGMQAIQAVNCKLLLGCEFPCIYDLVKNNIL